jgi:tetratricopeptide (TPR) repeat protein
LVNVPGNGKRGDRVGWRRKSNPILIGLLTSTGSANLSQLINENYRFNFKYLVKELNPPFVAWLNKMVEPNVKDRYANAAIALKALKSIEVMVSSTDKLGEGNRSPFLKPLTIGAIALAIVGFTVRITSNFPGASSIEQSVLIQSSTPSTPASTTGEQWFNQIKPRCNSVEVATAMRTSPPPNDSEGMGYAAGCYALAGKINKADGLIKQLPENTQAYAAGIVFNIGHPIADAGDDESAGPIMELVLKYWPENYMALYHAGMSEYALGDLKTSEHNLNQFLQIYQNNDSWRQNALTVLTHIKQGIQTGTYPRQQE